MKLASRNVIVTGGSQGLGRAIVEACVREGASVLLCARDEAAATTLAEALRLRRPLPASQQVFAQGCDVASEEQVEALFGFADEAFAASGGVHALINNAGIYGPKGATEEVSLEEWRQCLDINLFGTLLPCRAFMRRVRAAEAPRRRKIVNLSGGGATNPMPNISAYAASKAAVVRLSETLALELASGGVDVNAVAPGALNTRLLDEVLAAGPGQVGRDFYERSLRQAKEGGVPLELGAELCVYLASNESDGITGRLLSAKWDPWRRLASDYREQLGPKSDIYTLRRITPEDRQQSWPLD